MFWDNYMYISFGSPQFLLLLRWRRWREDHISSIWEWSFIYREKKQMS